MILPSQRGSILTLNGNGEAMSWMKRLCNLVAVSLLMPAVSALAGGGNVLPAEARIKGYSLEKAAAATAVYNTGQMSGNPATPPPPKVPFQVLVGDCTVGCGTSLYLPIFVVDDSGGAPAGFPTDIRNQDADAAFLDQYVLAVFDVTAFVVQVDGKTTVLDEDYIVGAKTPPLLDGTPAGTNYIVSAAFLTPLTRGAHTVALGGLINGQPVIFLTYTVTVK